MNETNPEFQIHSNLSEIKKAALTAVISEFLETKANPASKTADNNRSEWVGTFEARKTPKTQR